MESTFIVTFAAGPHRDHAKGTREQPFWDEHALFIDCLVEEGFIARGGPLPDERGRGARRPRGVGGGGARPAGA